MSDRLRNVYQNTRKVISIVSISFMVLIFIGRYTFFEVTGQAESLDSDNDHNPKHYNNILFISSYHSSFPSLEYQLKGLYSVFDSIGYQMDVEYMDSKRFYTQENLDNFHERMAYKMSQNPGYELVIAGDDNALQYVMDKKNLLFEGLPVIYFCINDMERAIEAHEDYGFTGLYETSSPVDTINLGMELFPKVHQLNIIVDGSASGLGELNNVMSHEEEFSKLKFNVLDLRNLSYSELEKEMKVMESDEMILLISAYSDKDNQHMSFYEYLDFITDTVDIPILHLYSFGVGEGLLGGRVIDFEADGRETAKLALEVLNGREVESIPPILDRATNVNMLDYEVLTRLGVSKANIPLDVTYVNRPIDFFEEHIEVVVVVASIFTMLLFVILILTYSFQRSKKAEEELQVSNEELATMYEEMRLTNKELEAQDEKLRSSYKNLAYYTNLLEESERRYKYVFELSHAGLWERDIETKNIFMTSEWYLNLFENFGYSDIEKLSVDKLMDLFYRQLDNTQLNRLNIMQDELVEGIRSSYVMVLECCKKNEPAFYIEERAKAIYNKAGVLERIIGSHTNITSSVLYEQQLEEFAYKDQLTKLPNRIILEQKIDDYLKLSEGEYIYGSVFLIDIDNFKFVNNTFGHEIGDELLQLIAKRLDALLSEECLLGRISGDEFVVIAKDIHQIMEMEILAKRILGGFETRFDLHDRSIYVTVSFGISVFPENGRDLDTLLYKCNSALNEAKSKGKNRYDFYNESMDEVMDNRVYIQNNIRQAIDQSLFELYFQPIYSVVEDKVVGFEALIRWRDPVYGFIPPLEFIIIAENMGLINRLGDWVLKQACKFIKDLNDRLGTDYYVSVNVSSVQLSQHDYVDNTTTIIKSLKVPFKSICIELTETALMESFEQNASKLISLRDQGMRISLDDFGTGYSSLNYLRQLPVDVLKIDKSFIDNLMTSKDDRQLTEGIILLAQKMGIYVIAEGIEEEEQLMYLINYACNGIQGYYISRPLPANKLDRFLEEFQGFEDKG